jgi:hypothetical protein
MGYGLGGDANVMVDRGREAPDEIWCQSLAHGLTPANDVVRGCEDGGDGGVSSLSSLLHDSGGAAEPWDDHDIVGGWWKRRTNLLAGMQKIGWSAGFGCSDLPAAC